MKRKIRICMLGMGRTGREIASEILAAPDMELVMAVCGGHNPHVGEDVSTVTCTEHTGLIIESGETLISSLKRAKPDVAIDFTSPEAVMANAPILSKNNVNQVIGTTGFAGAQLKRLQVLAENSKTSIVYAPNITMGVNVLMTLVNLATTLLEEYDCSVVETHFKNKKDKPSGTAVKIAEQARKGIAARSQNTHDLDVPVLSLRSGGVIGRHSVVLAGEYDRVEIAHESFSRKAFAAGALRAAWFSIDKKGWFEMRDVLNLENALINYLNGGEVDRAAQ